MSKTQGRSLPELKRDKAKLDAIIAAEEQEQALKKRARERELLRISGKVLVPASPSKSPRKSKVNWTDPTRPAPESPKRKYNGAHGRFDELAPPKPPKPTHVIPAAPRPSTFLSSVGQANNAASTSQQPQIQRSSNFTAAPAAPPPTRKGKEKARDPIDLEWEEKGALGTTAGGKREEDGTVAEKLEMGPKEFGAGPGGDLEWKTVEPNSGIRLLTRVLSHETLQNHLADRYHVPPSLLYSIIRLSRDGTFYDIPLLGDWITIAVVAEQSGGIKFTKGGPAIGDEASDDDGSDTDALPADPKKSRTDWRAGGKKPAPKNKPKNKEQRKKKFVTFKLVSLPGKSSGRAATGGDASLTMLLFEADSVSTRGGKKYYKGGSGGAFERFWNLRIGSVVAIMNPRVLRPMKGAMSPHPLTNALAINPESAESITEIGMSRDIGTCTAVKLDGTRCSSWIDKRVNEVCEYHLAAALKKSRSGRAEFSASTSAFAISNRPSATRPNASATSRVSSSSTYNPATKTGLLPRDTIGSASTYIVGGQVVRPDRPTTSLFGQPEYTSEKIGRHKDAITKRKREDAEAEAHFLKLLGRDAGRTQGGKNLVEARRKEEVRKEEALIEAGGKVKKKKKAEEEKDGEVGANGERQRRNKGFSAEAIKRIGFDPTLPVGQMRRDEGDEKKRVDALALLFPSSSSTSTAAPNTRAPLLGPVPGPKHRTSVAAPTLATAASAALSSDDDLEIEGGPGPSRPAARKNFDDEDDLEIEGAPPARALARGGFAREQQEQEEERLEIDEGVLPKPQAKRARPTEEEIRKARMGGGDDEDDED